ncbi:hypothetical protein A7A08_00704 [Methyloligella halotolerans]|uniref:Uncharacterized protein n=1 Tax=Methyloligella halotolerans TaxID=1177755 RepID=A0A1E2S397_9HYPH|nr:hypothetical protein A7A08_00704 [Methyloligella halotolerans]
MNDTPFDTVIGKFRFDAKGDPNLPPYAVYRWEDGKYAEIDSKSGEKVAEPGPANTETPDVHPVEAERPGGEENEPVE